MYQNILLTDDEAYIPFLENPQELQHEDHPGMLAFASNNYKPNGV